MTWTIEYESDGTFSVSGANPTLDEVDAFANALKGLVLSEVITPEPLQAGALDTADAKKVATPIDDGVDYFEIPPHLASQDALNK